MASLLLVPVVVVCVALFIIIFVFSSRQGDSNEERMNDFMRNLYIYLVCFATLMMSIGGGVALFMAVSDIIVPNEYYMSFEEYKNNHNYKFNSDPQRVEANYSEEELRQMYEGYRKEETERTKLRAKNSLIKSLGWIVIPLPIFIYFTRRLRQQ